MKRDKMRKKRRTTSKFAFDTCQWGKERTTGVYGRLVNKSSRLQEVLAAWMMQQAGFSPGDGLVGSERSVFNQ